MMIFKKWASLLLATTMMAGVVAGCSGGGDDADTGGDTGGEVDTSTYINYAENVELASMDAQVATDGYSFTVLRACNDALVSVDANGEFVGGIAETWSTNDDQTVWTFNLREDAKWSNGADVTAGDFVFAWQRLASPDTASEYQYYIADISAIENAAAIAYEGADPSTLGAKAIDAKTLEVTLERPVPYFLAVIQFPIMTAVNEEFYNTVGDQYGQSPDTILANGAYMLTYWEQGGTTVVAERNPNYWNADAVVANGINFITAKDAQTASLAYEQGTIDLFKLTGELVDQYRDSDEFQVIPATYFWYIGMNFDVPELQNLNLRKALGMAFDKAEICEDVLKDGSVPADFVIPHGLTTGPTGNDFREDSVTGMEYNATEALAYWEAAKAELGIETLELSLLAEDTDSAIGVATYIQNAIQTNLPGVTINVEQMPKKTRLARGTEGDFELTLTRWGADYADPTTYFTYFTSTSSKFGARDAAFDQLVYDIDAGEVAGDPTTRWNAMIEAEKMMLDTAAVLPIYQKYDAVMQKSNVTGIERHNVEQDVFQYAVKTPVE